MAVELKTRVQEAISSVVADKDLADKAFAAVLPIISDLQELQAPPAEVKAEPTNPLLEQVKLLLKEGWEGYNKGQAHLVLEKTETLLDEKGFEIDPSQRQELHALRAWCHYRRSEWPEALNEITLSDNHPRAIECNIYILSYAPGYRDDQQITELTSRLGNTLNTANAFVIRARLEPDGQVPYDRVEQLLSNYAHLGNENPVDVSYANLLHNSSRVFFDRARDHEDLSRAAELINDSIRCYGTTDNSLHHRGAAHYWQSRIFRAAGDLDQAIEAAKSSLKCWQNQVAISSTNPSHLPKYSNAYQHLAELAKEAGLNVADILKAA